MSKGRAWMSGQDFRSPVIWRGCRLCGGCYHQSLVFSYGGRWTPFLTWSGYGKLVTKNGTYPLYISFYPSSHFSRLHLDGLRPTGGVQGNGWLCTAPGTIERLSLSGTIYNGWSTTEGSLMGFRLNERNAIDLGQHRGYFDLYGRWEGLQLVMDDRGRTARLFAPACDRNTRR